MTDVDKSIVVLFATSFRTWNSNRDYQTSSFEKIASEEKAELTLSSSHLWSNQWGRKLLGHHLDTTTALDTKKPPDHIYKLFKSVVYERSDLNSGISSKCENLFVRGRVFVRLFSTSLKRALELAKTDSSVVINQDTLLYYFRPDVLLSTECDIKKFNRKYVKEFHSKSLPKIYFSCPNKKHRPFVQIQHIEAGDLAAILTPATIDALYDWTAVDKNLECVRIDFNERALFQALNFSGVKIINEPAIGFSILRSGNQVYACS